MIEVALLASIAVHVVTLVVIVRLRRISALYQAASDLDRRASIGYRRAAELDRECADLCRRNAEMMRAHLAALTRGSA